MSDAPRLAKVMTLVARHRCGCVSMLLNLEICDGNDIMEICTKAKRRKCWLQKINVGDPWEVEVDCGKSYSCKPKAESKP